MGSRWQMFVNRGEHETEPMRILHILFISVCRTINYENLHLSDDSFWRFVCFYAFDSKTLLNSFLLDDEVCRTFCDLCDWWYEKLIVWFLQVSQGDATEKLAHQVAAQVAAADRRVEEASGDTDEEEKDEAHKSSKGHVSGKYSLCCTEEC